MVNYAFFTQNNPKKLSVIEIFSIFAKKIRYGHPLPTHEKKDRNTKKV